MTGTLSPIPKDTKHGWEIKVTRGGRTQKLHGVSTLELTSQFGKLEYGLHPFGYDTICFEETGGGGVVVIPYFIAHDHDDEIWVGLVRQKRPFQSKEPVLNAPRGFRDLNEGPIEAAMRETAEEIGGKILTSTLSELPGEPVNPNSTFFATGDGGGVRFFKLEVTEEWLKHDPNGGYRFREELKATKAALLERILGAVFVPAKEALKLADGFTIIAVARLLYQLGRI
jgi:hypothetical protein